MSTRIPCHLILQKNGQHIQVVGVRQGRPALAQNQAALHLILDVPRDFFEYPDVVVPVSKPQIAVAIEPQEPTT